MARIATKKRITKETDIEVTLNLDGTGNNQIDTGIGFFDHMLDGMARHGLFDLTVKVNGDLDVDCHHTIEDTGIVIGQAILEAVGDKAGIKRFGHMILPLRPLRRQNPSDGRDTGTVCSRSFRTSIFEI